MSEAQPAPRRSLRRSAWTLLVALGLAVLAGSFGRVWWVLDLAAHPRVQYAYIAALLLGCFAMARAWLGLACAVAMLGVTLVPVFSRMSAVEGSDVATGVAEEAKSPAALRVFLCNVRTQNERHDRLLEVVREAKADLVALLEVDQRWLEALGELHEEYPHRITQPRADNFGIALFSRHALESPYIERYAELVPSIVAKIRVGGQRYAIYVTHPLPPVLPSGYAARNAQLEALAHAAREAQSAADKTSVILVGDLNITPWSPIWHDFVKASGLVDSGRGFGPQGTWPSRLPGVLRIAIDHCLHSSDLRTHSRSVGPKMGSDHLPVLVELRPH